MRTSKFNDFWRGKEVKTEPLKIQKSDFKTLWKGGEAALAKGAMDELKNYIQLRLDQNIPQDKALDQAIAVNGRLPEMKRLDPSEVEVLVEQVYNKTQVQKSYDKDFSVAQRMMARENSIQDSLGLNGGDQSHNPDFLAKVKMMDTSGINPNVMAILEDENYHSLVSALIQVKGAPHPANKIKYDKPR